ncbi:sensor histidine kinase [Haloferax namakaokahaiae]|uniref:histidine kinase n=1 Tax=Haloferax namakaokahaiae TaxID=1748331 RepID=A0ABD5ZEG4_9EURY
MVLVGYVYRWLTTRQIGDETLRLAGWMFTGILVFGGSGVLVILYQRLLGGVFLRSTYSVLGWATGGIVIGLIVGIYDVARRISMREMVEALARAERLSEQLRVYNRVLRHDVRTAANITAGYADLVLESPASQAKSVEVINQQMDRIVRLTDQSRKIANLHRHSGDSDESFDFTDEIERRVAEIETEFPAVEVYLSLPTPPVAVTTPSLTIAFGELLRNAVEHNTNSTPEIEVLLTRDEDELTLRVEDNGPGTPQAEIDVLDAGYETQLEHSDGTGLWLVKWIVDELDGDLTFENDARSTVTIAVPTATV